MLMPVRVALLGEGALALRCLQMLQGTPLLPSVIVSSDGSLAPIAAEFNVPHLSHRADWLSWLADGGCDLLLSIRSPWVLHGDELRQVRVQALNFHDSLLPDYAGMHATSWALLNGEVQHGVTWHEMGADLGGGGIAAQATVPVHATDTALALNARCFDKAVSTFQEVLTMLQVQGRCPVVSQMGQRRYFSLRRRPAAQALLHVQDACEQALRLIRALDFGHANNPLALPKLAVGGQMVLIAAACHQEPRGDWAPGTLLHVSPEGLHVAFADGVLCLSGLRTLEGAPLAEDVLTGWAHSLVGSVLPSLTLSARGEVSAMHEKICVHERQWIGVLAEPVNALPHHDVPRADVHEAHDLPRWSASLAACPAESRRDWALATFTAYMARIHHDDVGHLGLWRPDLAQAGHGLFASVVPWALQVDLASSVSSHLARVAEGYRRLFRMGTYSIDLRARAPELSALPCIDAHWPVALVVTTDGVPHAAEPVADLLMTLSSDGSHLGCMVSPLCPSWVLERLDARLAKLASAMIDAGDVALADLPLMDAYEWHQVVVAPNSTVRELPDLCVHELISQQARRTPHADAVVCFDQVLSHGELDDRSDALAHRLRASGVCRGTWVALAVGRSADAVIAILAIFKAGAAYVPLDVQVPAERLGRMIHQVQPALLLTQRIHVDALREHGVPTWCLDELDSALPLGEASKRPGARVRGDDMAYCIFTSGSTGVPKGVEIMHRGLVNHALAMVENYQLSTRDRVLCSASFSFDVSVEQMLPTLLAGACIVMRPDDLFYSMSRFDQWCREMCVSVTALPTAWWHEWVRHLIAVRQRVPEALRVIAVGTEKARADALLHWVRSGGVHTLFLQGYGPTEATITCTMFAWQADDHGPNLPQPLPVGRPLPNTQVYLLDTTGQPVPMGVEGEIYIAGVGLARGYLGMPELTEQHFKHLVVSGRAELSLRMYRTGDRAMWSPEGQLVFLGRKDHQVKIRGHRVELGEIESALKLHDAVQEAVVLLRDDLGHQPVLVAYVLSKSMLELAELKRFCDHRLPNHMVPSRFMVLQSWPLTMNGKVDRRNLPVPPAFVSEREASAKDRECHDVELVVARMFSDVLGRPDVPMDVSFFDLGGDSLRAITLITRLELALSARLSLVDVFAATSVRKLSERIQQVRPDGQPLILKIREGAGVPVWLLAGIQLYSALAESLTTDNPVFVVVLPDEDALLQRGEAMPSVRELASRYVAVIRAQHPHISVVVGGFSFGGAVAYEVAQAMRAENCAPPWLILIDTILPSVAGGNGLGQTWLGRQWQALKVLGVSELKARAKRRLHQWFIRWLSRHENGESGEPRVDPRPREFARILKDFEGQMQPYKGKVLLFRSRDEEVNHLAPAHLGWGEWIPDDDLHVCDVDGSHLSIMAGPGAKTLGRELSSKLDTIRLDVDPAS